MKILFFICSLFYLNTTPVPSSIIQDGNDEDIESEIILVAQTTIYGKNEGETSTTETAADGTTRTTINIKCDSFFEMVCYTVGASAENPEHVQVDAGELSKTGLLISWNQTKNIIVLDN